VQSVAKKGTRIRLRLTAFEFQTYAMSGEKRNADDADWAHSRRLDLSSGRSQAASTPDCLKDINLYPRDLNPSTLSCPWRGT